jgi:hypothetical protein
MVVSTCVSRQSGRTCALRVLEMRPICCWRNPNTIEGFWSIFKRGVTLHIRAAREGVLIRRDHASGLRASWNVGRFAAAAGVQARLRGQGRGFAIGSARVPIVPAATMFDLLNGGNKDWGALAPYRELGVAAVDAARSDFHIGSSGASVGATTADLRGGLGSASAVSPEGYSVGALVVVNANRSIYTPDSERAASTVLLMGRWPQSHSIQIRRGNLTPRLAPQRQRACVGEIAAVHRIHNARV